MRTSQAKGTQVTLNRKRYTRIWIVILTLSVAVRLGVALYYGNWVPTEHDDFSYSSLGLRLATGHGYTFDRGWYPFTRPETPTAHWSFLYTAVVAGVYAIVGFRPVAVRIVGAVLGGVLLPWMTLRLARRLWPDRAWTPLVAGACAAGYAFFILYAARIMTETFYIITLLWSLERAIALGASFSAERQSPAWGTALGLGISLGLTALFRQAILPWVPVLFGWLVWKAWRGSVRDFVRTHFRVLFLAGIILLAFILPWTYRNYRVFGDFLLLNSNTGYAMYAAQHPLHGTQFQAFAVAPLPPDLLEQNLTEVEWDKALMRRGIGFIVEDPGRYVLLSLSRVLDYFEFWPTNTALVNNAGRLLSFTLFLPFMLSGIYIAGKAAIRQTGSSQPACFLSHLKNPVFFIFLFMAFYTLLHVLTWAMPRYRLPVDATALPFAALALEQGFHVVRARRRR